MSTPFERDDESLLKLNPIYAAVMARPNLATVESAIEFLTEKGYQVTPPPKPQEGYVIIYHGEDKMRFATVVKAVHAPWKVSELRASGYKVLASKPWMEGEGV